MKDSVISSKESTPCDTGAQKSDNLLNNVKGANSPQASKNEGKQDRKKRKRKSQKAKTETANGSVNNCSNGGDAASPAPKMNAFQFMMNSRHKSFGRNSPGRDLDLNESTDSALSKKELKARKSRLESWAEQKGASKRKREYEEVGDYINYKLEKREKKMKKLLKIDCQSDDEVIMKRRRKCPVIESDGEDGVIEKDKKKGKSNRLSLNVGAKGEVKLTSKSVKSWKLKIKLRMDENKENGADLLETEDTDKFQNQLENSQNEDTTLTIDTSSEECVLVNDEKTEDNNGNVNEGRVLRSRRSKPKSFDDYFLSDDDDTTKKKNKKTLKVAPVFLKSVPKPKLDPKLIEAKRQFLMSGVPSSLKKEMERQQCIEEMDFTIFPTVSHVQQKSPNNVFWDLPKVELKLTDKEDKIEIKPFSKKLLSLESPSDSTSKGENPPSKIKNCKKLIREIKSQNPDYPVYKIFNSIYSKSGYKKEENGKKTEPQIKTTPKRKGRSKRNSPQKPVQPPIETKNEESNIHAMWTEKYKPKSSSDIIGNHNGVSSLKEWLENWTKPDSKKKVRRNSDSESEFDITDGDSRDSAKMYGNTVILKGPTGSGKSAAVYAVCNELGFSVLEVNASSKRTGKRLLQELQEATQSHQVCKSENILSFVKEKPKMCVLLVEDVDVVFEQDEGFTAALSQIIATTKRPIILTATDDPCSSIQKITNEHRTINFSPLSSVLTVWLQIVCLVEGFYLNTTSIEELLSYNKGDIRRTLLQLQLYVNSGGQRGNTVIKNEPTREMRFEDGVKMEDDSSNMSDLRIDESSECGDKVPIHQDCFDGCHLVENCNDLETIWWNWPSILNLGRTETNEGVVGKEQLRSLADCYDSLAFADVMCGRNQFHDSLERRWRTKTKDSLVLDENLGGYRDDGFCGDLAHTVLSGRIKLYKEKYGSDSSILNMAVPPLSERRWRCKQLSSEEKLHQVFPLSEFVSRKSISLDYVPCLRTIVRSEFERAANNTKRKNRFYHYLRNLGVRCSDSTYKMACDVFKMRE